MEQNVKRNRKKHNQRTIKHETFPVVCHVLTLFEPAQHFVIHIYIHESLNIPFGISFAIFLLGIFDDSHSKDILSRITMLLRKMEISTSFKGKSLVVFRVIP